MGGGAGGPEGGGHHEGVGTEAGGREEGAPGKGRQGGDSGRTRASSSQRAARIHEKLLDDSLTELSKSGAGPPSTVRPTIPGSVAESENLRLRRAFRA